LSEHLAHFGIHVSMQQKTEKSMAELQLEQNLKFDFSMTTEDGRQLEPLFGPGYTGLKNLGNSCYMASVIQALFTLPSFHQRYTQGMEEHFKSCMKDSANCFHCQMYKLADGLWSGRYSLPVLSHDKNEFHGQEGIAPSMFKALIGKDHPEFSTMRQQVSVYSLIYKHN
jgi:ubiquitin carboxyl-terminal hydrolase 5/13